MSVLAVMHKFSINYDKEIDKENQGGRKETYITFSTLNQKIKERSIAIFD